MTAPEILLVIPTLGTRESWLKVALASVAGQRAHASIKIKVVAPSGSNLGELCGAYGAEFVPFNEPGQSAAIAEGWRDSNAKYVTWLCDDDILAPGSLSRCVEALEANSSLAAAYGRLRYIDKDGATLFMMRPGRFASRYIAYGRNMVPQPGSLLRRSAVNEVGGLDLTLKNCMDQDLFTRLFRWGAAGYVSAELAAFRVHDTSITVTKGNSDEGDLVRQRYLNRMANRYYLFIKRFDSVFGKSLDAVQRRLPPSRIPQVNMREYTRSDAYRTASRG